jgi:GTPase
VSEHRCGTVALIGRPNVGKSTLLNALVGQKLSITSRKPQTTRHRIRGVLTTPDAQYVFVDTPGFQTRHRGALNRLMNRGVKGTLEEVDVAVLVIEAGRFGSEDRAVLKLVPPAVRLFLVPNKIDRIDRETLLRHLRKVSTEADFAEIVPVSAQKRKGTDELLRALRKHLPEQPPLYSGDEITDRSERFFAAELVREKLFRLLGEELPYGAGVTVEKFEQIGNLRRIHAAIVVDKDSHKAMVIGARGGKLKEIGTAARTDMEKLFGGKVYLEIWVKVRHGWTASEAALKSLGYD